VAQDVVISSGRSCKINVLAIDGICLRKRPQNARVQDEPFVSFGVNDEIIRDLPMKAAKFVVNCVIQPEREDVRPQLFLDACFQI